MKSCLPIDWPTFYRGTDCRCCLSWWDRPPTCVNSGTVLLQQGFLAPGAGSMLFIRKGLEFDAEFGADDHLLLRQVLGITYKPFACNSFHFLYKKLTGK